MAVYRTKREYFLFLVIVFIGIYTIYRGYTSQLEVKYLRNELNEIKNNVHKDTHEHINEIVETNKQTNLQLQIIKDIIGKITSKTNEFSQKFPELEEKILGIKQHHEEEKHQDSIENLHEKIGLLEGVLNEIHVHQEEEEKEKEKIEIEKQQKEKEEKEEELKKKMINSGDISDFPIKVDINEKLTTVLLVIASTNRPDYLKKTLDYVAKYHPKDSISILVSEDGESPKVHNVVSNAFEDMKLNGITVPLLHIHHPQDNQDQRGYYRLSRHFKWALNQVFSTPIQAGLPIAKRVIILEEDLQIAPDFFEFFTAVTPFIDNDDTILAASAWNDNGLSELVKDPKQLYRSDFFPGLGWMMSRRIWEELEPIWPVAYWDDWLREPKRRKGRHTIRPEICRTFHFAQKGVSAGEFSDYLNSIFLNEEFVQFTKMDLSYLDSKTWDHNYITQVLQSKVIQPTHEVLNTAINQNIKEVQIQYKSLDRAAPSFVSIANLVGAMDNIKANVPRTAYRGVVTIWYQKKIKIHIVPFDLKE